jgi:hypothetical protein
VQHVLFNQAFNIMNKILRKNLWLTIIIVFLICTLLLVGIEGGWNDWSILKEIFKEIIIVLGAAIVVSLYFEFRLRYEISFEFNKILEMKEEFGKAGLIKYFSNYKDIDIRKFFNQDVKIIDIYVNYGNTFFKDVEDKLESFCKKPDVQLSIYILSKENPFIKGLGNLWGKNNPDYNEEGIKNQIDSTTALLKNLFERLKANNTLKAKVRLISLKRHPVFYSFQRFDDEIIYVPSKLIEPKSFKPLSFLCRKTMHGEGIFNKCMAELDNIKSEKDSIEVIFEN